jgi:D-alanyl-D-alanine carboxypeptidase (penicillin-binding protein 5/6)
VETIKLFNWGAATWSQQVMLSSSQPIADVPVRLGDEKDTVVVRPSENITAMLPNTFETDDLELDYTLVEDVVAPVKAGDVLGELTVRYEDKEYQLDLVAADDVERSTMLYVLDRITAFFTSTTFKIIVAAVVALIVLFVAYVILINRKRAKRRKNRRR